MSDTERRPNHLADQTSPYLLQHAYNPVDWYPWGEQALQTARAENRPIFLSIGYAACHWCHVMERESFEDPEVAAFLNEHFVAIKVDREERPDLDEIYMNAVQLLTGAGGWPLNIFLTPALEPFVGGTYFPPRDAHGRIGFLQLLRRIQNSWVERRPDVDHAAAQLTERLQNIARGGSVESGHGSVGREETVRAVVDLIGRFEPTWGGFGPAPKFPPDGGLALLLREHGRTSQTTPLDVTLRTLDAMALGGLYDQIGGGFARYSVDEKWLVPHFEKMLYNQALLVPIYLDAWTLTARPLYRRVAEETLDFVRREMTSPGGGFFSSLDADSEGEEGRFYVWTPEQVEEALGPQAGREFCAVYGIERGGNFEGRSIPNLLGGSLARRAAERQLTEQALADSLAPLRHRLAAARERRVRPATDDKILTAWNGLMITAFARGYQVLQRDQDLDSARRAADFLLAELRGEERLVVSYRAGRAALNAYLDDYAFSARGLLDLYEAGFDDRYLAAAGELARTTVRRFEDRDGGGFYFTSDDHETLLTRNRSLHDGALPSGAGVACEVLLRLGVHLDDHELRGAARRTLGAYRPLVARYPAGYAALLLAAELAEDGATEVALVGDPGDERTERLLRVVRGRYLPRRAVALSRPGETPGRSALLAGKTALDGRPTAYVCRDYACRQPTDDPQMLARLLDEAS